MASTDNNDDNSGCATFIILMLVIAICANLWGAHYKLNEVKSDLKFNTNQNTILQKQLEDLDKDFKKLDSALIEHNKKFH